jgi:DNA-binding CsgD family transcriptional regulator
MGGDDRTDALRRLNETEREFLRLLGRGHTAKSIAAAKDVTVAAVNERFRSARRKTGLGSSREIARLILAQENRDEFIDLAKAQASVSDLPRPHARRRASAQRWRLPMAAAVLLAAALLAQQTAEAPSSVRASEPLVKEFLSAQEARPSMAELHALANSGRDPDWSPAAERRISEAYNASFGDVGLIESFVVTCGSTVCEAVGLSAPNLPTQGVDDLLQRLQSIGPESRIVGLEQESFSVGPSRDHPGRFVFASYWRRA